MWPDGFDFFFFKQQLGGGEQGGTGKGVGGLNNLPLQSQLHPSALFKIEIKKNKWKIMEGFSFNLK